MLWVIVLTEEASFIITLSFGIFGGIEFVNINIEEVWVVCQYLRCNWNEVGLIKQNITGVRISLRLHYALLHRILYSICIKLGSVCYLPENGTIFNILYITFKLFILSECRKISRNI